MNTIYVKEFVKLAECLSYSEASSQLFISQSSLTKHIQALERDLGVQLFERTTRSIKLTEVGAAFLDYAEKIVKVCEEARITIDDIRNKSDKSLTIAVMNNPQYYDAAKYLVSFRREHPGISFKMVEADEAGLYRMFRHRQVNAFPTFEDFHAEHEPFEFIPMVESFMYAIYKKGYFEEGKKSVALTDLAGEKLLLPAHKSTLSRLILKAFSDADIDTDIAYEGSSTGCIELVKAGMGVSIHAAEFAKIVENDPDIVCVPIEPAIRFRYGLAYRDPGTLSHAEQIYLTHMKKFELK